MGEEEKPSSTLGWVKIISIFSIVIIPLLYLNGYLFHFGYLGGFSVHEAMYPRGFEYYLIHTYFALVSQAVDLDKYYWTFALITTGIALFILSFAVANHKFDEYLDRKFESDKHKKSWLRKFVRDQYSTVGLFLIVLYLPVFFIIFKYVLGLSVFPFAYGDDLAERHKEAFISCIKEKVDNPEQCPGYVLLKRAGESDFSGSLVTSSETMISIYDHNTNRTSTFKLNASTTIETFSGAID